MKMKQKNSGPEEIGEGNFKSAVENINKLDQAEKR